MEKGIAKLPAKSKVIPIYAKLSGAEEAVYIGGSTASDVDWIVTELDLYAVHPDLQYEQRFFLFDPESNINKMARETLPKVDTPLDYWAAYRLRKVIQNKIAGVYYIGFLLFVGDLKPF
jgi:hypothetical protein